MDKTIDEIKKALYKEKPIAIRSYTNLKFYGYTAILKDQTVVKFIIPISEMGDLRFGNTEQSQLLIRWIKQKKEQGTLRKCDNCGKEYLAITRQLKNGKTLCCSKSCAAQKRERDEKGY